MKKILLAACLCLSLFVVSCGESIYGDVSNRWTNQAKKDALDFAFIQDNCQLVINQLEQSADANRLGAKDLYKYNNSLLACSGFNLVGMFEGLLGGSGGGSTDPFDMIQKLMGTDLLTPEESAKLKDSYGKILKTCEPMENLTEEMKTICGMTAASDTVRILGDIAMDLSGNGEISLDADSMGNAIKGKTEEEILKSIQDKAGSMDDINRNLGVVNGAAESLDKQTGGSLDIANNLDQFTKDLAGEDGVVTEDSLNKYLNGQFGDKPAETPAEPAA